MIWLFNEMQQKVISDSDVYSTISFVSVDVYLR